MKSCVLAEGPAHLVQFYEHDEFLHAVTTAYVAAGLRAREQLVLFASPSTVRALHERLGEGAPTFDRACRTGRLTVLDARETLARFMEGSVPHRGRFNAVVGTAVERSASGRLGSRVRVLGEMVDLLCRGGEVQAAIEVEELWNDLAQDCRLLCVYALASFHRGNDVEQFRRVCALHSQVAPAEPWSDDEPPDARRRWVAGLQQRVVAVEAELERCKQPVFEPEGSDATLLRGGTVVQGPLERLTKRQREVLELISEDHSTRAIADRLGISVKTVETHRAQLMKRLGVHGVAGLVRHALRAGLVSPDV